MSCKWLQWYITYTEVDFIYQQDIQGGGAQIREHYEQSLF